jgi:hypothetical protein
MPDALVPETPDVEPFPPDPVARGPAALDPAAPAPIAAEPTLADAPLAPPPKASLEPLAALWHAIAPHATPVTNDKATTCLDCIVCSFFI